jgi:hypothetical protein
MLPEALSNELCSLKPNVDRLCFVAEMVIDAGGAVVSSEFYRATMRSRARLTYNQVAAALDGQVDEVTRQLLPQLVLLLRFGPSGRRSSSFGDLVERYRGRLAAGGQAGRFAPSPKPVPEDTESGRDEIVARWRTVGDALRSSVSRWSESALDRCRLPHPLLGKLTVREMVMFMLYHDAHHLRLVAERLPEGLRERALDRGDQR